MKRKIISVLIVIAVLATGLTTCTTKDNYLIQVMKIAPINTGVISCMDMEAIVEDPDFSYTYDYIINYLSYQLLDDIDMDISTISAFATAETDWHSIFILVGDFNLEDIRGALEYNYFVEGEYKETEVWTNDSLEQSLAFMGNMIVASDTASVETCIRCHKNEDSSMYDDKDIKSVADMLPTAVGYYVFGSDYMSDIEILAGGTCVQNKRPNDEVLNITGWYKFDSATSAETSLRDTIDEFEYEYSATLINSKLRGEFIEITGEISTP